MMEEFCAIGTWDRIAGEMRDKYAGLATLVNFEPRAPRTPDEEAQIRELVVELKRIPTLSEAEPAT